MAHFCEHATFKGTARRNALQIINRLENVGGDLNAFTTKEMTVYHAAILHEHVARAVDLLTDIVFSSTYPQAEIEKEVEVICDEIESYNDSPAELIYDEFENIVFCGHPLGHSILGSAERLRTYSGNDIARFARRHYRPSQAVFFAYGDISFSRLVTMLRKATAGTPAGAAATEQLPAGSPMPEYRPQESVISRGTHQAHVMLGTRAYGAHDDGRVALSLLNNILGGPGMSARLSLSLRERHGLVYSVESSFTAYSDTGLWSIYFGCDPHDIRRCLRLVRHELDRVMQRPLTAGRLAVAKKQMKGQIAIACDQRENFALGFAKAYLLHGRQSCLDRQFELIDAVTAEQLQDTAIRLFAPDRLTTLIIN